MQRVMGKFDFQAPKFPDNPILSSRNPWILLTFKPPNKRPYSIFVGSFIFSPDISNVLASFQRTLRPSSPHKILIGIPKACLLQRSTLKCQLNLCSFELWLLLPSRSWVLLMVGWISLIGLEETLVFQSFKCFKCRS